MEQRRGKRKIVEGKMCREEGDAKGKKRISTQHIKSNLSLSLSENVFGNVEVKIRKKENNKHGHYFTIGLSVSVQ